jgi:TIGR03009 family protein
MRRLPPVRFAALLLCGLAAAPLTLLAQQQVGKARFQSDDAPAKEERPDAQPLRVAAVDPQLEAVLAAWHNKTKDIKKLQGQHTRWTFEKTFQVAKSSSGKFYYEAPDRGRIDLLPDPPATIKDIDPKQEGTQVLQPGTPNAFTLKPDQPERWICDGKQVLKIDDTAKTYEAIAIPPEHRGQNIIDGPLPFLFGLPPDKAKQRYAMKLGEINQPNAIYIIATPLQRFDAANWQRADIMLDATTYLPTLVKLLDPSGNRVTFYSFREHKIGAVNLLALFGAGDPFKPILIGHKQVQAAQPVPLRVENGEQKPVAGVPAVVGMNYKQATAILKARGYPEVICVRDNTPSEPKFQYHVKSQSPPPNTAAAPGQKVTLTLYVTKEDLAKTAQSGGPK